MSFYFLSIQYAISQSSCDDVMNPSSFSFFYTGQSSPNNVCDNDFELELGHWFEYRSSGNPTDFSLVINYNARAFEYNPNTFEVEFFKGDELLIVTENVTEIADPNDVDRRILTIDFSLDIEGGLFEISIFATGRIPGPHPRSLQELADEDMVSNLSFNSMNCGETQYFRVIDDVISANEYLVIPEFTSSRPLSTWSFFQNNQALTDYEVEDLVVDANWDISAADGTFHMKEDATIRVLSGNVLSIDNYNFIPCDNKWNSIIVESGATLSLSNCTLMEGKIGLDMMPGSTLSLDGCLFDGFQSNSQFERYSVIEINGNVDVILFDNNEFGDVLGNDTGVKVNNGENIQLTASDIDNANYFASNTIFGIELGNSSAHISNNRFHDNKFPILSQSTRGLLLVDENEINYTDTGIWANGGNTIIRHNDIGVGLSDSPSGSVEQNSGDTGIRVSSTEVDIHDNVIHSVHTGINAAIILGSESDIFDNVITVEASSPWAQGIEAFLTQNLSIENNFVLGDGLKASIVVRSLGNCEVISNTTDAGSENGIVISGGGDNDIIQNLVDQNPDNGILNEGSAMNSFIDNDIHAGSQGLSIEPISGTIQTIKCNNFLDGNTDLNVESVLGTQEHHQNLFREEVSVARTVGLSDPQIEASRFIYDQTQQAMNGLQLFVHPDNDADLFDPQVASNDIEACSNDVGYNPGLTPEIFCEELLKISAEDYLLQLRILLGRYFETHGPSQLPDCIQDCHLTQLSKMEAELREAMEGAGQEGAEERNQNTKTLAQVQLAILESSTPLPSCGDPVLEEVYEETYEIMLVMIAMGKVTETQNNHLMQVAGYCPHEYGEVVTWARGLLSMQGLTGYDDPLCDRSEIEGRRRIVSSEKEANFTVYPSPANNYINIEGVNLDESIDYELVINDYTGVMIGLWSLDKKMTIIETSHLPEGLYTIMIKSDQDVVYNQKLVIVH